MKQSNSNNSKPHRCLVNLCSQTRDSNPPHLDPIGNTMSNEMGPDEPGCVATDQNVQCQHLHAPASSCSSCVEHLAQRLFFSIAAGFNKQVFGGDAKDACAHSPGSKIKTHMTTDDTCAKWHLMKHGKEVDWKTVLPTQQAQQGGPESG